MPINITEYIVSEAAKTGLISKSKLSKLKGLINNPAIGDQSFGYLADNRQLVRAIKWHSGALRKIKHQRCTPVKDGNFISPITGLTYKIRPESSKPHPLRKYARKYARKAVDAHPEIPYELVSKYDIVYINKLTPPKLIRKTLCMDIPTELSCQLGKIIGRPVLRVEILEKDMYKIVFLEKEELLTRFFYIPKNSKTFGRNNSELGAKSSYQTKIANIINNELT